MIKKIALIAMVLTLAGCSITKEEEQMEASKLNQTLRMFRNEEGYSTKEEAITYMQKKLETKYGEEFVINEQSVDYDDETYPTTITTHATAYSKSRPGYQFKVYSRSNGYLSDSYGNYRFLEGAQKEAEEFCAGRDYVESCDADLTTTTEVTNLLEKYPTYEDYRLEHSIYYNVKLKGRNPIEYPADYALPITEMITDILEGEYGNGYLIAEYVDSDGFTLNMWWQYYGRDDDRFLINSEPEKFLSYDAVLKDLERSARAAKENKQMQKERLAAEQSEA